MVFASAREPQRPVRSPTQENISSRSAPHTAVKDGVNSKSSHRQQDPTSKSAQIKTNTADSSSKQSEHVKTRTERKRENTKLERKDSMQKFYAHSTNLNGNVNLDGLPLNGKLVDTYHIPDATLHLPDGFRGGRIQGEMEVGPTKGSKNGRSELHCSTATDLSQQQWYQLNGAGKTNSGKPVGPPRSTSSSSSRDDNEPHSESSPLERYDRNEV